jgi:ribose transport system permease protein
MAAVVTDAQRRVSLRERLARMDQAHLAFGLTIALCVAGALTTDGFLTARNLRSILELSVTFGILGIAAAIVIIGKGLDLSIAAIALVTAQATIELVHRGMAEWQAITVVVACALLVGLINGLVVAFVEVPALFTTLATGQLVTGGVLAVFLSENVYLLPGDSSIAGLTRGSILGLPQAVVVGAVAFLLAWLFMSFSSYGRLIRAMGDNFDTARTTGAPVRPLQIFTYVIAAGLAAFAGYVMLSTERTVETTGTAFHPLLFTAVTVAVIGGVSLSGGKGTLLGVLAGTLFIGVLNNLLVLHSLSSAVQDIVRGAVLVAAIGLDAWLHPRDEETAKTDEL